MNQVNEVAGMTLEERRVYRQSRKDVIEIGEALTRLENNPDFKKVFIEGYSESRPQRLTMLLADNQVLYQGLEHKQTQREDILEELVGIARFNLFLRNVRNSAAQAEKDLDDLTDAENEARKG